MVTIRTSRIRKHSNKKWKVLITVQIISALFLLTLITGLVTSDTEAYFSDNTQVSGIINIGTWNSEWTGSSLVFSNKNSNQTVVSCNFPTEISALIINTGSNMNSLLKYEVYYISNGNPMSGEKVGEGFMDPLAKNQSVFLKYNALKAGNYKFRAFQPLGHGNKDEIQDLWSETITITCNSK
ncbi:amyloid fiber anchoring/assembly protein TapA [Neobacillus citreus]|uniref:Amyloid fiber anchoring/assembly protein TapA n=1 Tax=Neobacillus citreus TaxID=2833578 RepID=A0A942T551_9BACI|nr:amyloid fiber anchoring/assembly protein TapA [Neobacillus citreus]